ncbi:sugar phosphate nucleotidyltransferase [Candidatus Njordibacter sp. Uisw_039]|uniref:sugar phosphate nucleotidyltransferase n=1 Tax=Candidatus Njordibacter sp. Uisw_039 TaxID=3230972 RepID=UPI003D551C64
MKLLILAGGFGTRLQSVVTQVPKALAPVGDVPFLYLQIENWKSQGLRSFVFLLHHQADLIINFLEFEKTKLLKDCEVAWVIEPKPMDTGGAVAYALKQLELTGDFLLTNADTWLGTGIKTLEQTPVPSMAVLRLNDSARYGQVQFDDKLKVTSFIEKSNTQKMGWISVGLCHLHSNFFRYWDGYPFSLERILFKLLLDERALNAVALKTNFIDIGIPADYHRFCIWIENNREGSL